MDNDNNGYQPHSGFSAISPVITITAGGETTAEDGNNNTDLTVDFGFKPATPVCKILYICGEAKPQDGEAFDHGLMKYIEERYEPGSVTPVLAKSTGATLGVYNPYNPATEITLTH